MTLVLCKAEILPDGLVKKGKLLSGMYFEGSCDIEKVIQEVEKKGYALPVMVYTYYSRNPPSKNEIERKRTKLGIVFAPRKQYQKRIRMGCR